MVKLADGNYQPIKFVLDSGADCTMVPRRMAHLVRYSLPAQPDTSVSGIYGGRMPGYSGRIKLQIQSEDFEVRCVFTQSNRTPFLLGRLDFFSFFNVQFDGRNCHIILERVI